MDYEDRMVFAIADVQQTQQHARTWHIYGLPTLLLFKGGTMPHASIGRYDKRSIVAKIEEVLL